jgi:hypothetical protein
MYEFVQKLKKPAIHPPTSSMGAHFIYIPYNKKTIRKTRLYKFIRVAYSHPLLEDRSLDASTHPPQLHSIQEKMTQQSD